MSVVALPEVQIYLKELILVLYENGYFGFKGSAEKYVEDLFFDIQETLHHRLKKPAPEYFHRYGKDLYYSVFPKNKTTQWYVFFSIHTQNDETIYLVRYISNNHISSQKL